jgi:hypothetical protein
MDGVSARSTLTVCHSPNASQADERCAACGLSANVLDVVETVTGDKVVVAAKGDC